MRKTKKNKKFGVNLKMIFFAVLLIIFISLILFLMFKPQIEQILIGKEINKANMMPPYPPE
jgi:ABC-type Na+ efflux pump permease subunit